MAMIGFRAKIALRPSDLPAGNRLRQQEVLALITDPVIRPLLGFDRLPEAEAYLSHILYTADQAGNPDVHGILLEMKKELAMEVPEQMGKVIQAPEFTGFSHVLLGLSVTSPIVKDILNMLFNGGYLVQGKEGLSVQGEEGLVVGMTPRDEAHLLTTLREVTGWRMGFIDVPNEPFEAGTSVESLKHVREEVAQLMRPITEPLRERGFTDVGYLTLSEVEGIVPVWTYGSYDFVAGRFVDHQLARFNLLDPNCFPLEPVSVKRPVVFGINTQG